MPKYRIDVIEVRNVSCTYVVEADTPEEAIKKAQIGDTEKETENGCDEVQDRVVNNIPADLEPEEAEDEEEDNE